MASSRKIWKVTGKLLEGGFFPRAEKTWGSFFRLTGFFPPPQKKVGTLFPPRGAFFRPSKMMGVFFPKPFGLFSVGLFSGGEISGGLFSFGLFSAHGSGPPPPIWFKCTLTVYFFASVVVVFWLFLTFSGFFFT